MDWFVFEYESNKTLAQLLEHLTQASLIDVAKFRFKSPVLVSGKATVKCDFPTPSMPRRT